MNRLIDEAIAYIKEVFQNDFSGHDFHHSLRVYKLAKQIAESEGANLQIVELAALLHDVDDVKLSPLTAKNKDNARRFLYQHNIKEEEITIICTIIDELSFKGTDSKSCNSLEGKCVQDADRLDAIGAIGIARAFAYGGSHQRKMYDPDIPPVLNMNEEEYRKSESTTLNHFYEKLFLLKDMMNTTSAKIMAEKRDDFMHQFVDTFLSEYNVD